jgi:hypothetical protein
MIQLYLLKRVCKLLEATNAISSDLLRVTDIVGF